MSVTLTPKQETFAQHLSDGLSQSEAFRKAYPASVTWKDASVWQRASVMAANIKVKSRVEQLRHALADLNLWTRADSVRVLREVTDGDKGAERVAAVKELNAMHGFNEPVKVAMSGGLNVALVVRGITPPLEAHDD